MATRETRLFLPRACSFSFLARFARKNIEKKRDCSKSALVHIQTTFVTSQLVRIKLTPKDISVSDMFFGKNCFHLIF